MFSFEWKLTAKWNENHLLMMYLSARIGTLVCLLWIRIAFGFPSKYFDFTALIRKVLRRKTLGFYVIHIFIHNQLGLVIFAGHSQLYQIRGNMSILSKWKPTPKTTWMLWFFYRNSLFMGKIYLWWTNRYCDA